MPERRAGFGLTTRLALAGALLLALVATAFALLIGAIGTLRDDSRDARRSAEILSAAHRAEKLAIDIETGGRGFVITGDESFLEPWRTGRRQLPRDLVALRSSLAGAPAEQALVTELQGQAATYIEDYSAPLVAAARRDRTIAGVTVASKEGKRRVDGMRRLFDRLAAAETRRAAAHRDAANEAGTRAVRLGVLLALAVVALLLAAAAFLHRSVIAPVVGVAGAARALGSGNPDARAPERGAAEVGMLATDFNDMAESLQRSREALEEHQEELASANEELRTHRDQIERAAWLLADEKRREETLRVFSERIAHARGAEAVAEVVLDGLAAALGAEAGAVYAAVGDQLVLLAGRGDRPAALPVAVLGRGTATAELSIPFVLGGRELGVAVFDRPDADAPDELLVEAAALGLGNALASDDVARLARTNQAVLDAVDDAIVLQDGDGAILLANPRARVLVEELFGEPYERVEDFSPEVAADRLADPETFLEASARLAADPDAELRDELELADSGRVLARFSTPVRDEAGGRLGRLVVLRDVTILRQAERLKSDLVATVSHELRTPLVSILGFTDLLLGRDDDAETRARYLGIVRGEGLRLRELIDDLLDIQRLELGGASPRLAGFDLRGLLREQAELYGLQSERHTVVFASPPDPVPVMADRDQLAQLVGNLLSNAIKYSPAGGPVTIGVETGPERVTVSVADTGLGIPPAERGAIFEMFHRVHSPDTRTIGGTGLGLALAKRIVEAHAGEIGVDSVHHRGSTFWFRLPRAPEAATGSS